MTDKELHEYQMRAGRRERDAATAAGMRFNTIVIDEWRKSMPNVSRPVIHRLCIVCGARVRNQNPKCCTCSPECTAIRNHTISPEIHFRHCGVCQSPITDHATSCGACGATDFEP